MGSTSGTGNPRENVAKRYASHYLNDQSYGEARLDKSSTDRGVIRGMEQLINKNGGAQSQGAHRQTKLMGLVQKIPERHSYLNSADKEFGY